MANATQTIAGDIQLAGDLAGNNNAAAPALSNTGVTAGTYSVPNITVDAKGRITSIAAASLGGDLTGAFGSNTLVSSGVSAGTYTAANITVDAKGRVTAASSTSLSGDINGSPASNTLATVNSSPGSYTTANITVDAKGRVTAASNGSLVLSGDVSGAHNNTTLATVNSSPGSYTTANITVDAKGRVTAASNGTVAIPDATTTTKGIVSVVANGGLEVNAGVLSARAANGTMQGVVYTNDATNISIVNGLISVGSNIPKLNARSTFTAAINTTPVNLTVGTTIDASLSNVFILTLSASTTLANPTNLQAGNYTFIISNPSGAYNITTYGTAYKFPVGTDTGIAGRQLSVIKCVSDGTNLYCSFATNFA